MTSITSLRSQVAVHRDARAQRRQLARELAEFATMADRLDLEALLNRHPDEQTRDIRQILAQHDAVRMTSGRIIGGHRTT